MNSDTSKNIDGYELSENQKNLWQIGRDNLAVFYSQFTLKCNTQISCDQLRSALMSVIQKHEVLRFKTLMPKNYIFPVQFASEKEELAADDFRFKLVETFGEYSLKYIEEEQLYVYYYGEFETPMEAYEFWIKMQEIGLEDAVVRSFIEEKLDFKLEDGLILTASVPSVFLPKVGTLFWLLAPRKHCYVFPK